MRYLNLRGGSFLGIETVLIFLNVPLGVTFFVKILSLNIIFNIFDFLLLLVLILIFASSLGLFY